VRYRQHSNITSAAIVLRCQDLDACISFFTDTLGFRVDTIFPADAPHSALLSAHGLRIQLRAGGDDPAPGTIRIECQDPSLVGDGSSRLHAPNGTQVELVDMASAGDSTPAQPSLHLSRLSQGQPWNQGRAGMQYRDLIPDRLGGSLIASHIRIPDSGPVPDYVHYHDVHYQWIFCYRGWVRVVYEDQGPPFVLQAGDCVLQPPGIRHRVLECSTGLEVLELASPAAHKTHVDHELTLPTGRDDPERTFQGQRFVWHRSSEAPWEPADSDHFVRQATGIRDASGGLTDVCVLRSTGTDQASRVRNYNGAQALFLFILEGTASLSGPGAVDHLAAGDALTMPASQRFTLTSQGGDRLKLLEAPLSAP